MKLTGEVQQITKNKKVFTIYLIIILLLGSFMTGLYVGRGKHVQRNVDRQNAGQLVNKNSDQTQETDFQLFWDVWDMVDAKFVGELNYQQMLYGAIDGMLASLDDPYTAFMDPEASKEFREEIEGTFEGIGAEIGMKNNNLTIVAPLPSSPAEKAGIRTRDIIVKINGEATESMTLIEAVSKIRGAKGSEVVLTIYRDEFEEAQDFSLTRDTIEVKSVKWELKKSRSKDIAHIEISYFGEETPTEFSKAITDIMTRNVDGVILDLRNNTGGFLESSIEVGSEFIKADKVIAIEAYSNGQREEFKSNNGSRLLNIPTVVLINEGTASASEIVAGALRDQNQIQLIGQKSFGKGSVQELETFDNGSSLRVSVAKWLTPSGENINGEGLTPDIEVDLTDEDYDNDQDPQLDKALEEITK